MAAEQTSSGPGTPQEGEATQSTSVSPTHHVGRTLESDGILRDVLGTALPVDSASQASSGEDSIDAVEVRSVISYDPGLRTRLPGDTSSDPHTDVGPDNATTAQAHPDDDHPLKDAH